MPLFSIITGAYNGTWDGDAIGCSEDGFLLRSSVEKESVIGDCYGGTVVDMIYRGLNCFLTVRSIAAATAQLMINPYGTDIGAIGTIGRLDSALGAAISLSAVSGTPAANAADLGTLSAAVAALAEGFESQINFNTRARYVPLTWRLLPSTITAVDRCYSYT